MSNVIIIEQIPETTVQNFGLILFLSMSDTLRLNPCLTSLPLITPHGSSRIPKQFSFPSLPISNFPGKSLNFPQKIGVNGRNVWVLGAWNQEGPLQGLDDSPVSVQLTPISSESQFDRVLGEAHRLGESVVIVWYVYCIWVLMGFSVFV